MASVDIVIPLYNKARCIGRAIRSVMNQTMTDWRLIVVDDGSTDGGPDIVRTFDDPRIEMIRQENAGPGAARNRGIERATSKYTAFLDADDEWYPCFLANALTAFAAYPRLSIVSSMYCLWPARQDMTRHWAKLGVRAGEYCLTGDEDAAWADLLLCFLHVWNTVLKTTVVKKYGGFYDRDRCMLGEDTAFFLKVGINERFLLLDELGACHHTEDSGLATVSQRPLPPFFADPRIVLDYCPPEKQPLLAGIISHMALRFAREQARIGSSAKALHLLETFPDAQVFESEYARCKTVIAFSKWVRHWVRLKRLVGPPIRVIVGSIARNRPAPPDAGTTLLPRGKEPDLSRPAE